MYISGSKSVYEMTRAYEKNIRKRSADTAKALTSSGSSGEKKSAEITDKNTDKIEFSAGSGSEEKILPERYKEASMAGKLYYKGNIVTQYELLETAVKTGAITLDENESVAYNTDKAMDALIYSKASPLYSWSNKLYSEDRMYVFRVEGGRITGMSKAWFDDGTTFLDVAEDLASGTRPCDIDPCKRSELSSRDPELYKAACDIGSAKRSYIQETWEFNEGHLTKDQYYSEMDPVFLLLFGKDVDVRDPKNHDELLKLLGREDFAKIALENYRPQNVRDEMMSRYHE